MTDSDPMTVRHALDEHLPLAKRLLLVGEANSVALGAMARDLWNLDLLPGDDEFEREYWQSLDEVKRHLLNIEMEGAAWMLMSSD